MTTQRHVHLHFKGAPDSLVATAGFALSRSIAQAPEIEIGGRKYPVHVQPDEVASRTTMRLSLPLTTPPGSSRAVVSIEGREYAATLDVHEHARVTIEPKELHLSGAPESEASIAVEVANTGNAPVSLAHGGALSMRSVGALSRGVRKAFKEPGRDFVARLIVLGDELKKEAVGDVPVSIAADFDALGVGDKRTIRVHLRIPAHLDQAVTWSGSLSVLGISIPVTLAISKSAGPAAHRSGSR